MTLKKIAKMANVSVSTVSRALNNSHDISEETKALVMEIAGQIGYFAEKKRTKMDNRSKNTANIAILCPEIISQFYSGIAQELVGEFKNRNCRCLIYNCDFDEPELEKQLEKCINDPDIDAVICLFDVKKSYAHTRVPVVALSNESPCSCMIINMQEELGQVVAYFKGQGIKNVAFAGEPNTIRKGEAFSNLCREANINCSCFVSDKRFDGAGEQAAEFFLKNGMPQAVLCAYDEIALGLISSFNKAGVKVPESVRVIGIDDIPTARYCFGGLSTIYYDFKGICPTVARDVLTDIRTGTPIKRQYQVKRELIIRNT